MINLSHIDITRSLFYQDAIQEGRMSLLLCMLTKRFGTLKTDISKKIERLSGEERECLADKFLGFNSVEDLTQWLANKFK